MPLPNEFSRLVEAATRRVQLQRDALGQRIRPDLVSCPNCGSLTPDLAPHGCNRCPACCRCAVCPTCTAVTSARCSSCRACPSCCRCTVCLRCRIRTARPCPICCRCLACCSVTPARSVHFRPREAPFFWEGSRKPDPLIQSRRFISAEIEVTSARPDPAAPVDHAISRWECAVVHDGSLGGDGFEINTAPAAGSLFTAQIHDLCNALAQQHAQVTTACGCHIHVDARDFGVYEIKRLIYLYAALEPALFSIAPPDRKTSHFCLPCGQRFLRQMLKHQPRGWGQQSYTVRRVVKTVNGPVATTQTFARREGDTTRLRQAISLAVYGKTFTDAQATAVKQDKRGTQRYRALNLHSWFHRKTIEWRLPEGTVDATTILHWGALLSGIMDAAYRTPEREILAMTTDLVSPQRVAATCDEELVAQSVCLLGKIVPQCQHWIEKRHRQYGGIYDCAHAIRGIDL